MSNPNTSEKSVDLDRQENITKGNISAKRIAVYTYDSDTDTLVPGIPSTGGGGGGGGGSHDTPLSTYTYIQKDTSGTTFKYYGYADANTAGAWAIKRITIATNLAEYVKGTSGYTTAWTNRASQSYSDIWTTF